LFANADDGWPHKTDAPPKNLCFSDQFPALVRGSLIHGCNKRSDEKKKTLKNVKKTWKKIKTFVNV